MNQMINPNDTDVAEIYIFDLDNTLYRHRIKCIERAAIVSGVVINSYLPQYSILQGSIKAVQAFQKSADGFNVFYEDKECSLETARSMQKHFDMMVEFYKTAQFDEELLHLLPKLAKNAHVVVASHTHTSTARHALSYFGFDSRIINHAFGIDQLGHEGYERKDCYQSSVYDQICELYGVNKSKAVLVEDSETNQTVALHHGLGRTHHIDDQNNATTFIRGELEKFNHLPQPILKGQTCSPV